MKIIAQTYFNDPITVYDTDKVPTPPSGFNKWIKGLLQPVVQVESNGVTLYKTGEFYEPKGKYWLIGIGGAIGIGVLTVIITMLIDRMQEKQ